MNLKTYPLGSLDSGLLPDLCSPATGLVPAQGFLQERGAAAARQAHNLEVVGSSPTAPIYCVPRLAGRSGRLAGCWPSGRASQEGTRRFDFPVLGCFYPFGPKDRFAGGWGGTQRKSTGQNITGALLTTTPAEPRATARLGNVKHGKALRGLGFFDKSRFWFHKNLLDRAPEPPEWVATNPGPKAYGGRVFSFLGDSHENLAFEPIGNPGPGHHDRRDTDGVGFCSGHNFQPVALLFLNWALRDSNARLPRCEHLQPEFHSTTVEFTLPLPRPILHCTPHSLNRIVQVAIVFLGRCHAGMAHRQGNQLDRLPGPDPLRPEHVPDHVPGAALDAGPVAHSLHRLYPMGLRPDCTVSGQENGSVLICSPGKHPFQQADRPGREGDNSRFPRFPHGFVSPLHDFFLAGREIDLVPGSRGQFPGPATGPAGKIQHSAHGWSRNPNQGNEFSRLHIVASFAVFGAIRGHEWVAVNQFLGKPPGEHRCHGIERVSTRGLAFPGFLGMHPIFEVERFEGFRRSRAIGGCEPVKDGLANAQASRGIATGGLGMAEEHTEKLGDRPCLGIVRAFIFRARVEEARNHVVGSLESAKAGSPTGVSSRLGLPRIFPFLHAPKQFGNDLAYTVVIFVCETVPGAWNFRRLFLVLSHGGFSMLVLTRKESETVILKIDGIEGSVKLVSIGQGRVRLGFDFPSRVEILREEIVDEKEHQTQGA